MATIVTRAGKGSPLTNNEVDANFTNLNTDKLEKNGSNLASKIAFDTAAALTPATGEMVWDAETGTVDIGLNGSSAPVLRVGEDQFYRVINQTGSTIAKGTLVMAAGTVGNSGKIKVAPWDGSQPSKTIMGLTLAAIPTEDDPTETGFGYILAFGKIRGIQTNGANYGETWVDGDIIYAGGTGGLTKTIPAAPKTKTSIAIVINAHASNGTLFVRPTFGSNLAEDELVQLTSLANLDALSYNSSTLRFENAASTGTGSFVRSTGAILDGATLMSRVNPLEKAVRIAMTAATSGSNGIQVLDDADIDFGIGNFAIAWKDSLPDWTPAANVILVNKHDGTNGYILTLVTTGVLRLTINGATYDSTVATGLTDGDAGAIDVDITRETVSADGSVVFTLNGVQLGASVAIAAASPATTDNSGNLYINGSSTARSACDWHFTRIWNRAKTVAENLSISNKGPALADIGASQTAVYTQDTSAGTDSWSGSNVTLTGNVDGIGGVDDVLKCEISATGTSRRIERSGFSFIAGKNYRLEISAYFDPVTNNTLDSIGFFDSSGNRLFSGDHILNQDFSTWVSYTFEFTSLVTATSIRLYMGPTDQTGASVTLGNVAYIYGMRVTPIGITGEWNASNAQSNTGQIFDTSGNGNHALLPASGATIVGRPTAQPQEVRWTNTWSGTSELQYVSGVNQAIFPLNFYIDSLIVIPEGGTLTSFTIGDGSDADYYATVPTPISSGTAIYVALDRRVNDGTNRKLTITPSGAFTGSVNVTVTGKVLERK